MDPTSLPDDVIFNEIIPRLNPSEIRKLCQTNKRMARICRDPEVWKSRIKLEFPGFVNRGRGDYQEYLHLKSLPMVPIYYNGDIIDEMLIYNSNFYDQITKRHKNIPKDHILFLINKNNGNYNNFHIMNNNYIREGFPFEKISVIVVVDPKDFSKISLFRGARLMISSKSKVPIYKVGINIVDLRNYYSMDTIPIGIPCNVIDNQHLEIMLDFITKQAGGIMLRDARSKTELCRQIDLELAKIGHRF